jgi:hypothetical protein
LLELVLKSSIIIGEFLVSNCTLGCYEFV